MREPSTTELLESEVALAADERPETLILACGAIAREILALIRLNHWTHVDLRCLPAKLHSTPEKIAGAVDAKLTELIPRYERVFVAYADCGTGGALDVVARAAWRRAAAGRPLLRLSRRQRRVGRDAGGGGRHLLPDRLPGPALRRDRRPAVQARPAPRAPARSCSATTSASSTWRRPTIRFFVREAEAAAAYLGLVFEHRRTGYGDLLPSLTRFVDGEDVGATPGERRVA